MGAAYEARELTIRSAQPDTFREWLNAASSISDAELAPIADAMQEEAR